MTDDDTRIYAQPKSYTFKVSCSHAIQSGFGLSVVFPSEYIVKDNQKCVFALLGITSSSTPTCTTTPTTNTISVSNIVSSTITAQTTFSFTLDSIISPGTFGITKAITINTIDKIGNVFDTGSFALPSGYFTTGTVTFYSVWSQDTTPGAYPVKYDFTVTPNGEVQQSGYLSINLPNDIFISNKSDFETSCGLDLSGFTNSKITCVVTNSGRTIQIKDGFLSKGTSTLMDSNKLYSPPTLQFTLNKFTNPSKLGATGAFGVTIYN